MNHERLDEIRELFANNLEGSGMREKNRARAQQLFDRVANAYGDTITMLADHAAPHEAVRQVSVEPDTKKPE